MVHKQNPPTIRFLDSFGILSDPIKPSLMVSQTKIWRICETPKREQMDDSGGSTRTETAKGHRSGRILVRSRPESLLISPISRVVNRQALQDKGFGAPIFTDLSQVVGRTPQDTPVVCTPVLPHVQEPQKEEETMEESSA